jgi:G2F domain
MSKSLFDLMPYEGEVLRMVHSSRGVDADGVLTVDIVMSGDIPTLPDYAEISILPYSEDYIQTGPGLY